MDEVMIECRVFDEVAAEDEKEKLESCIDGLSDEEKELIIRRYYYNQKPAEIAIVLDIPKKKVENRLYYVRQKLKKMMENQEGD